MSIVIVFYSFIRGQGNYLAFMDFRLSAIVFTACAIVQIVGFLYWVGYENLQFSECSHSYPYSGTKSICGEIGFMLGLALAISLPFLTALYWFLTIKKAKYYKSKHLSIAPGLPLNESSNQNIIVPSSLNIIPPQIIGNILQGILGFSNSRNKHEIKDIM